METMLVAVFDSEARAREASKALEALSDADAIRFNAGAIVTRQAGGDVAASCTRRQAPEAALGATAIGLLFGMAGGAVGLAVGAAIGLAAGVAADLYDRKVGREYAADVERTLEAGKSALVAQIDEDETEPVNTRLAALGGVMFRRALTDVSDEEYEKHTAAI
jgi:uncharacterized membrane protein